MDALREAEAKLTVYVHPSNAADVRRAVARQLSTLLFSYEDRFDGVLLAHEAIVESEQGKILNGLVPYFGVPVHANLLLYSPKPDMMLEGKVEMLGKESIHAIVLGVFSAAIMSDDIHKKFKFKKKNGRGKFVSRSDQQHVIKKGSMIQFSVKRVDTEMNCHITGSLIPPHTGSMLWLSVHDAEYALEINSRKSSRDINIKIEQHEQDNKTVNDEQGVKNSERKHKSKSRKRNFEER
ncbi:DNA-directed RNA polymerase I subunit rpa43-like isoform X1 [Oryza brachyantha]|nr:DNA-directed RNA polymerase I subunit rpa43-like isoform X1 [Oryza brachyantha]